MLKLHLNFIIILTIVAACSVNKINQKDAEAWIGHHKTELIASWGPPNYDSTIPPSIGEARLACRQTGAGLADVYDASAALASIERCAENLIADWSLGTIEYRWEHSRFYPGRSPSYRGTMSGNKIVLEPYGGSSPRETYDYCTIHFYIEKDIITSFKKWGNKC